MKLKRMIASVLALLLMVSLLPIGVMADTVDNNPAGNTVPEITSGNTMEVNAGTVDTNGGTVKCNLGHVETNNNKVTTNSGIVTTNEGKVITNGTKGTVTTNEKDVTYNQGNVETNAENGTVKYNGGKITTNEGTVNKNDTIINSAGVELKGVIETNKGTVIENNKGCTVKTNAEGGTVQTNQGLVETNNNKVTTNSGIVTTNRGTVITNGTKGTVTTNEKDVTYNKGNVVTNAENGTVDKNWGNIATNNGTVNKNETVKNKDGDEFKGVIETNNGTIETNNGTVITNNETGTVETNAKGGEIETNNGTVGKKDENGKAVAGTGNSGTIETNNGTVISNNEDGTVVTNAKGGEIDINNGSLIVNHEDATVGINNGDIELNYGDIDTNNDYVVWNYGTVETNNDYVVWNYGTVETNTIDGTVWNETTQDQNGQNVTGTVTNNYGTMITNTGKVDEDGRSIYKTEYGVQVQNTDGGAGTKLLQAVENTIVKLADLFKRDGYELVGYNDITPEPEYPDEDWDGPVEYALNNNPSAQELSATEFHATRPSILSLIWKAIVKPAAPSGSSGEPEPKTVQNNIPTTLSADQVKVGAYVRQGNLLFRIIEVGDDYIRVATVPKLSEQALADMLGFLKQHLSDAQIAKINGEPALLEQELVTYFFGGTFEHISFYAAPDLFA